MTYLLTLKEIGKNTEIVFAPSAKGRTAYTRRVSSSNPDKVAKNSEEVFFLSSNIICSNYFSAEFREQRAIFFNVENCYLRSFPKTKVGNKFSSLSSFNQALKNRELNNDFCRRGGGDPDYYIRRGRCFIV